MAKKSAEPKSTPAPRKPQKQVINLKGSEEYCEWLEEAHRQTRYPKSTIIRMGVELWAKEHGVKPPPEQ